VDTVGAGDAFTSVLLLGLSRGCAPHARAGANSPPPSSGCAGHGRGSRILPSLSQSWRPG
jgi:sugar/nucleoside kinase (ribokinase family)